MSKRRDIRVRDPYIVLCDGKYYMYATTGERNMEERAHLFYVDFSKNVIEITEELPI